MENSVNRRQPGIALITGGAQRLGKAMTEHLARQGWNVAIHYNTSGGAAEELVARLSGEFGEQRFMAFRANLTNTRETEELLPEVVRKMGVPTLLINNASVFDPKKIADTNTSFFDFQMTVNLKTPFILTREFIRHCGEGMIVNMTDTRITTNREVYAAYTLAKKSLWELTKMTAAAYGPTIRANAIAPGLTLAPAGKGEDYLRTLAAAIPMKRPGGIQPILDALDYLLKNDYLTGELLFCDGGQHL